MRGRAPSPREERSSADQAAFDARPVTDIGPARARAIPVRSAGKHWNWPCYTVCPCLYRRVATPDTLGLTLSVRRRGWRALIDEEC
jgi:hypothetical protein